MSKQKIRMGLAGFLIVFILAGGVIFLNKKTINTDTATESNVRNKVMTDSSTFKDGTYTAQGDYSVHLGPKHISVTITLKNGIITSASVINQADDPTSEKYQDQFISGFKDQVIGRNITDVNVTRVSGSSLTPEGFNNALAKIEAQAKM